MAKKKLKNKKYSLSNNDHVKRDELILKKIENIREKYDADRVWVAEFHNGNKTYSGKSFQKFSTTFESVRVGIAPEALSSQAIPASIFSHFFRKLSEEDFYFTKNALNNDDFVSKAMRGFWEARGIKSFLSVAIRDISGNFVGILCLDGVTNNLQLEEQDLQDLIGYGYSLAGYLE